MKECQSRTCFLFVIIFVDYGIKDTKDLYNFTCCEYLQSFDVKEIVYRDYQLFIMINTLLS